MRASDLRRSTPGHANRGPGAWPRWLLGTCIGLSAFSHAQEPGRRVVGPAEQQARDNERTAILREELARSEARLQTLAGGRTEHTTGSGREVVDELEDQRRRTLEDIAALRRELAIGSHAAGSAVRHRPAAANMPVPAAAWWDVYGKAPNAAPSARPTSSATQKAGQPVSVTRVE